MELLLLLMYPAQFYLAYWAWSNLPPASTQSSIYRWAKVATIVCALFPYGLLYQTVALLVAKGLAAKTQQATQRLSSASKDFGSRRPLTPSANLQADRSPQTGNPFLSGTSGAGTGSRASADSQTPGSVPGTNPFANNGSPQAMVPQVPDVSADPAGETTAPTEPKPGPTKPNPFL